MIWLDLYATDDESIEAVAAEAIGLASRNNLAVNLHFGRRKIGAGYEGIVTTVGQDDTVLGVIDRIRWGEVKP